MRRIYLMTDYGSSSLWTDEPCHAMVPLDALGLDEATRRALEAWSPAVADEGRAVSEAEAAAHRAEGLRLWAEVRAQLDGVCEVGLATFRPDPADRYGAVKTVLWDPADLPPDASLG